MIKSSLLILSTFVAILVLPFVGVGAFAFGSSSSFYNGPTSRMLSLGGLYAVQGETEADVDSGLLEQIRSMRVKELKAELTALRVSTADVFEKDELVKRLYQARKKKEKSSTSTTSSSSRQDDSSVVRAPLFFASVDVGMNVASVNRGGLTIQPAAQPYAAIQIELKGGLYSLTLLLDTACTGLVLRPSVVRSYNLPTMKTPATTTAAGGTKSNAGLTQIDRFLFGKNTFGPVPAAVQDIGALPSSLDGIMGLSFLNQFACLDLDFRDGTVALYKTERRPSIPEGLDIVAEAEMNPTRLAVYTVDVMLDGRGPVKMLVDTGASSSILNWKGVADLGLTRQSRQVSKIDTPMGAIGVDNVSMELTHRYETKHFNLGISSRLPGSSMKGVGLPIDIGDIPVLENMRADNVGGILGIDMLMRFGVVRMGFKGPIPRIVLLN